jgi:hypothetical protein
MKRLFLFSTFCILHSTFCIPADSAQRQIDGYPISNFGLTVNVGADGSMFGNVLQNTGTLGEWLLEKDSINFSIEKGGRKYALSEFTEKNIERRFPFVRGSYA